jgi:hypothetical protein
VATFQVFASVILAITIISVSLTVWDERRNINRIQRLINQYALERASSRIPRARR